MVGDATQTARVLRYPSGSSARFRAVRALVSMSLKRQSANRLWRLGLYGLISLACMCSGGCCRLLGLAYRTTVFEPRVYNTYCDASESRDLYAKWANEAWLEESQGCPDAALKPDYVDGFRDGFVEFVYAGGTGEPPPVPPRIYWNTWARDAVGKQRAADWFDGYRHGVRVAREGGFRARAVVQ